MESISLRQARRLALTRAGLLKPSWLGLPQKATGKGKRARDAALRIVRHFGYLQLDTVSIAGARSHAIVLHSRLDGFDPQLGEELLRPGEPLFEYWGHEASWLPSELYPTFEFRRQDYAHHPWWGDLIGEHPKVAAGLRERIREEGPLRSVDLEGRGSRGWWDLKLVKKVAAALWSAGELAIRERRNFQRTWDLAERVIPEDLRARPMGREEALSTLLLKALEGHGWAGTTTLIQTWRLRGLRREVEAALHGLREQGLVVPCRLDLNGGRSRPGWLKTEDFALMDRLEKVRPRRDRGVLLSPFDPLIWGRQRVQDLFDFHQILEIFKPAPQRVYGYYCLPVLAGEHLVGRVDLKAYRKEGRLEVLSLHYESDSPTLRDRKAVDFALRRYGEAMGLAIN